MTLSVIPELFDGDLLAVSRHDRRPVGSKVAFAQDLSMIDRAPGCRRTVTNLRPRTDAHTIAKNRSSKRPPAVCYNHHDLEV